MRVIRRVAREVIREGREAPRRVEEGHIDDRAGIRVGERGVDPVSPAGHGEVDLLIALGDAEVGC